MIYINETVPEDFIDLNLIQNGAYTSEDFAEVRRLSSIKRIISFSDEMVTFKDDFGVIAIIGYGGDKKMPALFAYIDDKIVYLFKKSYLQFMRHMITYMMAYSNVDGFVSLVRADSKTANKFITALKFSLNRTFEAPDNVIYNEYKIWRQAV